MTTTTRTRVALAMGILGLLGAAGCASAQAAGERSADDYQWRGTMPADGTLEIKGVNGMVFAEGAPGSEVVVEATLRGRRSDPSSVRIERVEHEGGMTFCAVYPTPDGEEENECAPGDQGRMNVRRNDVEVDFRIQVPADVPLRARTVNGRVEALDLRSDVDVGTVNGDVRVWTDGAAEARTVNGSIEARVGSPRLRDGAVFKTVNGSIDLDVPDELDAELDASWLNGGLEADLPLTVRGRFGRGHARGDIGAGGPRLEIATVNGSIRIH